MWTRNFLCDWPCLIEVKTILQTLVRLSFEKNFLIQPDPVSVTRKNFLGSTVHRVTSDMSCWLKKKNYWQTDQKNGDQYNYHCRSLRKSTTSHHMKKKERSAWILRSALFSALKFYRWILSNWWVQLGLVRWKLVDEFNRAHANWFVSSIVHMYTSRSVGASRRRISVCIRDNNNKNNNKRTKRSTYKTGPRESLCATNTNLQKESHSERRVQNGVQEGAYLSTADTDLPKDVLWIKYSTSMMR